MADPFEKKTYYAMTLDPVHIGTGGYRLGRVDNTITREPGTNIPKIPGSSISGATRAYTAMAIQTQVNMSNLIEKKTEGTLLNLGEYKKMKYQRPCYKFLNKEKLLLVTENGGKPLIDRNKENKEIYYSCAGKGADDGEGHCGAPDCEVCVPFGFSKNGNSFQGLAQFFDARILFFPVHSMIGPVWVICPSILKEHEITIDLLDWEKFKSLNSKYTDNKLNFGWLMLESENGINDAISKSLNNSFSKVPVEIRNRLFLISDKLFSRIINDNLEVRTSVAIDPATGAAEDGALFTYEAIPRSTIMWFEVVYNKPEYFRINGQEIKKDDGKSADADWIRGNVEKGFKYLETLGVGGMNTRGMGRLKILNNGG